jgi:hypothetical protein
VTPLGAAGRPARPGSHKSPPPRRPGRHPQHYRHPERQQTEMHRTQPSTSRDGSSRSPPRST